MDKALALKMRNISKEYYGNMVLKDISFEVRPGEIHALLGENGAGKSTLMNVLFGMPVIASTGGYKGDVEINGEPVTITSPRQAMELGVGMVHQEFMLIPGFTVTENIKIGREITRPNVFSAIFGKKMETLDMPAMVGDAKASLKKVGLDIEEYVKVAGLPVGYMQLVEIARELDKTGVRLLVFDEPTAVLTESEALGLMATMRKIAESGIAIIFITHRLDEVIAAADRITVLRDGQAVASLSKSETTAERLAELMIGREINRMSAAADDQRSVRKDRPALSFKNFSVDMPGERLEGFDLDVVEGEILGVGGLAGQGKVGVPNGLMCLHPASGDVRVFGEPFPLNRLGAALKAGIACVSEDRRGVGLLLDESIEDNIAFSAMQIRGDFLTNTRPRLKKAREIRKHALQMIELLDIRCTGPHQPAGRLSGGNQQKVCLARAITLKPKILIVSEPTRGIDIGAKELVLKKLIELNRNEGITIVMVSSELAELRSVCDRVAIVSGGRVMTVLRPDATDADFGFAMSGLEKEAAAHA